uniref:Heme haloperoxidase family profile domain-containing protein n=1 Tax=Globisporangium ultimum (strain ATCC 200006 / CBS 805.95 / DAOM BR144) TaxID=431595 RepID=K3WBV1_GLOUD
MVSIFQSLLVAAAAAIVAVSAVCPAEELPVGEYFRPAVGQFSGVSGTTAPYRRTPCPALNALANHGYLPRDGQNVTKPVLKEAIMGVYNLGEDAAAILLGLVPDEFNLDFLGTHNMVEHDASLAHADAYFGKDPAEVDSTLAGDLIAHADVNGILGPKELAAVRKARIINSKLTNPELVFGASQQNLAYIEASIFLLGFGGKTNESVSAEVARSFVIEERIPEGWKRASTVISVAEVKATVANIIAATV